MEPVREPVGRPARRPGRAAALGRRAHVPQHGPRATRPLLEGSLERKSRNKLLGYSTAYYVVTAARFLHEFKDSDDAGHEPKPELSIYLPDAVIGAINLDKFHVKGKDVSKGLAGKLSGSSELAFKAHSAADAERWVAVIKECIGQSAAAETMSPIASPTAASPVAGAYDIDQQIPQQQQQQQGVQEGVVPQSHPAPTAAGAVGSTAAPVENVGAHDGIAAGQPGMAQPGVSQTGMGKPSMGQPGVGQTGMAQPAMAQPAMAQPGMGQTVPPMHHGEESGVLDHSAAGISHPTTAQPTTVPTTGAQTELPIVGDKPRVVT